MTLIEACNELYDYLQIWYKAEVEKSKANKGYIEPGGLYSAADDFFKSHPEAAIHRSDILWDFDVIRGSYVGGCFCCDNNLSRATCRGIVVTSYPYHEMNEIVSKSEQLLAKARAEKLLSVKE